MPPLTRRPPFVTVLAIDGDRVKLGIQAPGSIAVLRDEVYQQLRASNTSPASAPTTRPSLQSIAAALRGRLRPVP